MYYSSGSYEAFARPKRPEGTERKSAYLIGSGLSALSAACFLVRDGQMKGERIHILEKYPSPGGICNAGHYRTAGYVMQDGGALDRRFNCLWDLMRSIPSLEEGNVSVLDEFCQLNRLDSSRFLAQTAPGRGEGVAGGRPDLSGKGTRELLKLFFASDEALAGRSMVEVFDNEALNCGFWLNWRTLFGFQGWHSALEVKRCLRRFLRSIGEGPDLSGLVFPKYSRYESIILPMVRYLQAHNVQFHCGSMVTNVVFDMVDARKTAVRLDVVYEGKQDSIDLTENDLLFITNGGCTEGASLGSQTHTAPFTPEPAEGSGWDIWRKITAQDPSLGHPDVFCKSPQRTGRISATVTTLDARIPAYIQKLSGRNPFSGRAVTGGMVTMKDSNWLLSWTFNRQPQFRAQPQNQLVGWMYGLSGHRPGNYMKKAMWECTGREICMEWLYHLGAPEPQIEDMAEKGAHTVPCILPYLTASFLPRRKGDRPAVVPEGSVNFAFLGPFAESGTAEPVFTAEYSVRTGMEAVYTLLNMDRGVPEVWGGAWDVRDLLRAALRPTDGKLPSHPDPAAEKLLLTEGLENLSGTDLAALFHAYLSV